MGQRVAFCFKTGYAYHKAEHCVSVLGHLSTSKGKTTMFLEAFFSTA
jgi:hypothetical protein